MRTPAPPPFSAALEADLTECAPGRQPRRGAGTPVCAEFGHPSADGKREPVKPAPETMSEEEAQRYRNLWGEVLICEIRDALWPCPKEPGRNNTGKITELITHQARSWFGSRDFATVCALAGVDPDFIHEHVDRLLNAPHDQRREFLVRLRRAGMLVTSEQRQSRGRSAGRTAKQDRAA